MAKHEGQVGLQNLCCNNTGINNYTVLWKFAKKNSSKYVAGGGGGLTATLDIVMPAATLDTS